MEWRLKYCKVMESDEVWADCNLRSVLFVVLFILGHWKTPIIFVRSNTKIHYSIHL